MNGQLFVRSKSEPAKIWAWNKIPLALSAILGLSMGTYGKFVKGYNNLWLVAGFLPMSLYLLVASQKQPTTTVENAYRYILAKRVATCELEANAKRMNGNGFTQSPEYAELTNLMLSKGQTLYDVENELVDKIISGKGKL